MKIFESREKKKFHFHFSGPASLEQKLKSMQQQLLEMTDIPPQIQAKVTMISKALERFMTMDAETFEEAAAERESSESKVTTEDDETEHDENDEEEEADEHEVMHEEISSEKQFSSIPEEDEHDIEAYENDCHHRQFSLTRESSSSCSYDDEEVDDNRRMDRSNTEVDIDDVDEVVESPAVVEHEFESDDEEITSEKHGEEQIVDEEKRKKHEKIQKLEQHWQKLCSNTKTIHK